MFIMEVHEFTNALNFVKDEDFSYIINIQMKKPTLYQIARFYIPEKYYKSK